MMSGARLFQPRRFVDVRGWFSEISSDAKLAAAGIDVHFVQENQSRSHAAGTVRGLHFQTPPMAQAKLVRCVRGALYDVVVDVRSGSPTFGRWIGAELSADNGLQFYIPIGFAHGFVTLEPETEILYRVSAPYAPACDFGIAWNDPALGINWPLPAGLSPILSDKDRGLPLLRDFASPFDYDGIPMVQPEPEIL